MSEASEPNISSDLGVQIRLMDCLYGYEGIALNDLGRVSSMPDEDGTFVLRYLARENRTLKYRFSPETELEVRGGPNGCFVMRDIDGHEHMLTLYYHANASELAPVTPGDVASHVLSRLKRAAMTDRERARHDTQVGRAWDQSRRQMAAEKFDPQQFDACDERLRLEAGEMMQRHGIVRPPPPVKRRRKKTS